MCAVNRARRAGGGTLPGPRLAVVLQCVAFSPPRNVLGTLIRDHAGVKEPRTRVTPSTARRWPWVVAVATLAVFLAANQLYPREDAELSFIAMFSSIIVAFVLVGA